MFPYKDLVYLKDIDKDQYRHNLTKTIQLVFQSWNDGIIGRKYSVTKYYSTNKIDKVISTKIRADAIIKYNKELLKLERKYKVSLMDSRVIH